MLVRHTSLQLFFTSLRLLFRSQVKHHLRRLPQTRFGVSSAALPLSHTTHLSQAVGWPGRTVLAPAPGPIHRRCSRMFAKWKKETWGFSVTLASPHLLDFNEAIEGTLSKWAKSGAKTHLSCGRITIQKISTWLKQWTGINKMRFDRRKCKGLPLAYKTH